MIEDKGKRIRKEDKTSKETNLKAENEKLTLPELVGQPIFSGSVMEKQFQVYREKGTKKTTAS